MVQTLAGMMVTRFLFDARGDKEAELAVIRAPIAFDGGDPIEVVRREDGSICLINIGGFDEISALPIRGTVQFVSLKDGEMTLKWKDEEKDGVIHTFVFHGVRSDAKLPA